MTDETTRHDDEDLPQEDPGHDEAPIAEDGGTGDLPEAEPVFDDAAQAEADEEAAALYEEEAYGADDQLLAEEEAQRQVEEVMADVHRDAMHARASWSLVHKELMLLLFANCLFFAGVLAAWSRAAPGVDGDPSTYINGLDTIRGALIFALAILGFFTFVISVRFRQLIVWPYLLNALFALWVGIPGFTGTIGKGPWQAALDFAKQPPSKSFLEAHVLIPLSSIPPGYWLLTAGGLIVLIILVKGVLGGASQAKRARAATGGGARERRRRR